MTLSIIAAMADDRVIGRDNALPWHLPEDLKRFKRLTEGHTVIMGRRTFESIKGGTLPNRRSIVVTRRPDYSADGAEAAPSLAEALKMAGEPGDEEVFVIGGAAIYAAALPLADRMYLTVIDARIEGDTHFPAFNEWEWTLVEEEHHDADDRHLYAYCFRLYERK